MSKIVWDAIGEHYFETGLDHGILYVQKADGTYNKGVAWNGLMSVSESPSGAEDNAFWADNMKYVTLKGAEEYGGTIGAYTTPPEFAECDGSKSIADGVTVGQQKRSHFGFCYRTRIGNDTQGDDYGYKLHLIYNASASPSEQSHETTNESPSAIELSYTFTTTPIAVEGYRPFSKITIDSSKVDGTKLASFEAILQGSTDTEPRLPLPEEVIAHFAEG